MARHFCRPRGGLRPRNHLLSASGAPGKSRESGRAAASPTPRSAQETAPDCSRHVDWPDTNT
eukprot:14710115-Alexandrium_andersonii.AAC.1